MNRTGHKGRVDTNQAEIINALLQHGITAKSIASVGDGVPDVIAGYRGITMLLEVKRYGEPLTEAEKKFRENWSGSYAVVYNPVDAVETVIGHVMDCGKV